MTRNVKPAPLFLRPSVVRAMVDDLAAIRQAITAKAVVNVPILPIELVDRPRRSEDPRLAKANDDIFEQREPAGAGEGCQPGWVAQPDGPSAPVKPSRGEDPAPIDWPDAPLPEVINQQNTTAESPTADHAGGCEGRAPEGTSGSAVGDIGPANARQPRPIEKPLRNLARKSDVMYRSRINADARELEHPVDTVVSRLAALRQESDTHAVRLAPKVKTDWARVAAAHRAKSAATTKSAVKPLVPAPSREECPRCGIPGWKGCTHFLPYEGRVNVVPSEKAGNA